MYSHWFLLMHALSPYWAVILLLLGIWFSVRNRSTFISVLLFGFAATLIWIALDLAFYVPFKGWPELMGWHWRVGFMWPLFLFAALLVGALMLPQVSPADWNIRRYLPATVMGVTLAVAFPIIFIIGQFLTELPFDARPFVFFVRIFGKQFLDPKMALIVVSGAVSATLVLMLRRGRMARSAS
jgi:hypothetical protein